LKFTVKIVLTVQIIARIDDKRFYMNITKKKFWAISSNKKKIKEMTRNNLTNQELLKELEKRLPDFTLN